MADETTKAAGAEDKGADVAKGADTTAAAAPAEKAADKAASKATKAEVFSKDGGLIRTYDVETHGKDFAKNAQELSDHTVGSTVKLS